MMANVTESIPHSPRWPLLLILVATAGLFVVRSTAPHNFLDKDQERPASYILDAVVNGHWVCQTDWMGDVTSKPPMLTWIGALLAKAAGGVTPMVLFLPSALAWTALAFLVFLWSRRYFGQMPALFGALLLVLSPLGMRLFILLRTDALFAFAVAIAAACAWRAWQHGSSWIWFWLAAAVATLTKGPLGVVLGAGGLLAAIGARGECVRRSTVRHHVAGVALYLVIVVGWFVAAYAALGSSVADKLLRRELFAHAANIGDADPFWERLPKPTIYFLHRMLPWSLLAVLGMWRAARRPADALVVRAFERFLLWWFIVGLAIFSVTQHQRGDLLAPILAPAMALAGREVAYALERMRIRRAGGFAVLLIAAALAQAAYYYHRVEAASAPVRETECIRAFANQWARGHWPLNQGYYVDVPFTLQLYLGTMRQNVSQDQAVALLASPSPAWVALSLEAAEYVKAALAARDAPVFEAARCQAADRVLFVVLTNRP